MAYSDNSFNSMKQEAVRRVREMQKRSRSVLEGSSENVENAKEDPKPTQGGLQALLGSLLGSSSTSSDNKLFDLAGIPIDEEKALIGMLIYILYKQGADVKLLLGLGYLLL